MVDSVTPTTDTTDTDTTDTNTTDTNTTTHDFDRDRFTAWQMFRGTSGINLRGCVDAAKLSENVSRAVDTALAVFETTSEDGDDCSITYLVDELTTIARQLDLLSDCAALCTDTDNADGGCWHYLSTDTLIRQAVDGGPDERGEYSGVRDAYRHAVEEVIACNLAVNWGRKIARLADEYDAIVATIDAKRNE